MKRIQNSAKFLQIGHLSFQFTMQFFKNIEIKYGCYQS